MRRLLSALTAACALLAGSAAANDIVSVAMIRSVTGAPFFIGQELRHFEEQGITIELKFLQSSTAVAMAVVSGDADVGATAFSAGFYNLAGKGAIKVIGATGRVERGFPLSGFIASRQAHAAGLTSMRDLSGRTVAVTTAGSPTYYAVHLAARKYGYDFASVSITALQTIPNLVAAVKSGQIDATMVPVNVAVAAQDRGEGIVIGWDDEVPYQISAFFVSTRSTLERRALLERFVRGYQKSARVYNDAFLVRDAEGKTVPGPGHERLLTIIAEQAGQKPEQIARSLGYFDPHGRLRVKDIHDQVAFWQSIGQVDAAVKAAEIIDLSFIDGHLEVPAR